MATLPDDPAHLPTPPPTPAAGAVAVSRPVALQAAEWFVLLTSGEASADDIAACERWRAADPAHEQAWWRAQQIGALSAALPPVAGATLRRDTRVSRRKAIGRLAVLIVALPSGWLAWREAARQGLWADYRTATGVRRVVELADGSRVHLNTASAIDVDFSTAFRRVVLRAGEIFIETAPDGSAAAAGGHRPFVVQTAQGLVQPLGTRFVVRDAGAWVEVAVSQGAVRIATQGGAVAMLRAGRQSRFDALAVGAAQATAERAPDWSRGVLAADDVRLGDFLDELARHRRGIVRCDPAVADLRLTGAYQLRDTDAVLQSLAQVLPIRVTYRSRYWVTVGPRESGSGG